VSWTFRNCTFGNWTFCIQDILYPGRSVTGHLVTPGHYVTGQFKGCRVARMGEKKSPMADF